MPLNFPADFERLEKTITTFCNDRIDSYFGHEKAYKALQRKVALLDDIIDLRFKTNESFIAEVALPVVRKRYKELRAFTRKYFEADPLFTCKPIDTTPLESARNLQLVLSMNMLSTRFREKCFHWLIDNGSRYGVYVCFQQYVEGLNAGGYQTQYSPNGASPYERVQTPAAVRKNVCNYPVHPLNYFQDPNANYYREANWKGFIDTWTVAELVKHAQSPFYIQKNIESVIKDAKKGQKDQYWYGGNGAAELRDYSRGLVNVRRMWTTLPFEGNEDDDTIYYVEIVGSRIIRINETEYDRNIIPLTIGTYYSRQNVWWGNTDLEEVIPHQNISNWLINTTIESTMKLLDRFIVVRRGNGINWSDVNNRHQLGGVVPYDGIEDPSKLIYPVQFQDRSLDHLDWLTREIKQSVQESSPVVNMQNRYNQGGLNNSTLGAAQMVAGIGDVLQSDCMNTFAFGIEEIGYNNTVILQQFLDDIIEVRGAQNTYQQIEKREILGNISCTIESSMRTNDITEFTKQQNKITQLLNWAGTGRPEFQQINLAEMLKDWLRSGTSSYSNVEQYLIPPQPVQPQMAMASGANAQPAPTQMPIGTSPQTSQMGMA